MMKRKFQWIPPILWGLLTAVLSLIPGGPGNFQLFGVPNIDKIGHFGMYGVWTFLIFYALSGYPGISLRRAFWITFILGTLVGVVLEFGQYAMTLGRSFEINDMIANGFGSLIGAWLGQLFYKFRNQYKRSI